MAIKIGRVIWPGVVGIGAGIIKGAATFVDLSAKADALEVGSITLEGQPGNSGQTVWKYVDEMGIRHNAGLPNPGAVEIVKQFQPVQYRVQIPWGLNVAVTPGIADLTAAAADIAQTTEILLRGGLQPAWITVNVSSPDTSDVVEMLAEPQRVRAVVRAVMQTAALHGMVPVWVKIPPTLTAVAYQTLGAIFLETGVEAIVATNTMVDPHGGSGGWGGEPVRALSGAVVWQMRQITGGKIPIVGVGGILTGKQVKAKLDLGATATQVVSALLFRGREAAQIIKREYELELVKEAARR